MIEKLRKKFILVTMAVVLLVMSVVLIVLNTTNYFHTVERADEILTILTDNDGNFPDETTPERGIGVPPNQGISAETPFETRYFIALANSEQQVVQIDTTRIRSIDSQTGQTYAEEVLASGKEKGYINDFRYQVIEQTDDTIMLVFVDSQRDLQLVRSFFRNSILIGVVSLLFIFLLVFYFSRKIVKPVQQTIDRQKQFITDAGHEIKTPLAIISANNDVQEMLNGSTEWTESTNKQIQRLNGLMESMLQLTQMEEEGYQPKIESVDLSQIVKETAEPYVQIGRQKKVAVSLDIQPNAVIQADVEAMNKLCSLLMDNANKYVQQPGVINIRLDHQAGNKIKLQITNTVSEMPKQFDQLFDRFYREDQARKHSEGGYGIGLSLAATIVENHHGQIKAVPLDDHTIAFEVILPSK
ncbi:HAMP domain-containing histidine kinase [Desemzia sp. RIT804]|uniref:sensor histidine kinase n=1 Tax=Desemzia sp. RIT 804 TaxID=2810209 RepID=UPI00194E15AA|nr:HAMP domain-containing sensor histidine kinase [Desemzia sp. RIT 804]MBM6614810.1 HAMP domain-containing histidine kinase [Desemzia sp. RIT 804]